MTFNVFYHSSRNGRTRQVCVWGRWMAAHHLHLKGTSPLFLVAGLIGSAVPSSLLASLLGCSRGVKRAVKALHPGWEQPCWLLIGVKRMVLGSPFSGAVACGDRQEGNELGCLCPRHMEPQTQPGVAECRKPPGQLRLGTKSCWLWQGEQLPEALSTPAKMFHDS